MTINVGVLTHNEPEAFRLLRRLRSAPGVWFICVLDDHSESRFREQLNEIGAIYLGFRHLQHDFAMQRNALLSFMPLGKWTMLLDADEMVSAQFFKKAIEQIAKHPKADAFKVWRRNVITGIDKIGTYQTSLQEPPMEPCVWEQHIRLFKNERHIRYVNRVHEVPVGAKEVAELPKELFIDHVKTAERCLQQRQFYRERFYANSKNFSGTGD